MVHPSLSCVLLVFGILPGTLSDGGDTVKSLPGLPATIASKLTMSAGQLDPPGLAGQESNTSRPLILWLQGGPGASSLFGMFTENGPFRIESAPARDYLIAAEESWVETSPVLYIDQPFGTGFSPPSKSNITQGVPFATTEAQIAEAAEAALLAFFEKHPVYAGRPFYIFGESFAGWVDPVQQNLAFPQFAYSSGLISAALKEELAALAAQCVVAINAGDYVEAFNKPAPKVLGKQRRAGCNECSTNGAAIRTK
eukprot:gene22971-18290_t